VDPSPLPAPPADVARPAPLRVVAGACTDVGAVRTENQDCYGALPPSAVPSSRTEPAAGPVSEPALFVVADGMGGHEAGGEASRVAVAALLAQFGAGFRSDGDVAGRLGAAVGAANAAVWERANTGGHLRRMGTTCTVLLLAGGHAVVGHVGDSRAYRLRDGRFEQVTTDHTLAEAARTRPGLAEIARTRKHHLTRALGVQADVEVDAFTAGPALADDRFLLCSDGLEPVPPDELQRALHTYSPQEAAEWLVALASARGSRDNATAVVVHVLSAL
jgi:serine/threonine protein phosphatase PrpC